MAAKKKKAGGRKKAAPRKKAGAKKKKAAAKRPAKRAAPKKKAAARKKPAVARPAAPKPAAERAAAASVTNVPRSLASALSPLLAGALLQHSSFGWPLVFGGMLKLVYDLLLLRLFRHVRPPDEVISAR